MKSGALVLVMALVSVAACDTSGKQATSPTEPAAAARETAVADRSTKAPSGNASSTTCAAYQQRLDAHQATLERFPGDEAATEAVATYTSLIADACS